MDFEDEEEDDDAELDADAALDGKVSPLTIVSMSLLSAADRVDTARSGAF